MMNWTKNVYIQLSVLFFDSTVKQLNLRATKILENKPEKSGKISRTNVVVLVQVESECLLHVSVSGLLQEDLNLESDLRFIQLDSDNPIVQVSRVQACIILSKV